MNIKRQRGSFISSKVSAFRGLKRNYFKNTMFFTMVSKETGRMSQKCLLVLLRVLQLFLKKEPGAIFQLVVSSNHPVTSKGLGIRIGKGKGSIKTYVCKLFPGMVLFKVQGISLAKLLILEKYLCKYSNIRFAFYGYIDCGVKNKFFLFM